MDWCELKKLTGIEFPLDEGERSIYIDKSAFATVDLEQVALLVPEDCKLRARYCAFSKEIVGYDKLSRFLDMFPNLARLRFYNCWHEGSSFYKAFKDRPIEDLELSLFANDAVCFDSLSTLPELSSLHLPNLNSAVGLDTITSSLKKLTIHAPDLTMDQCIKFNDLESLDIFSDCFAPEVDYPRLAELPSLRTLSMPVFGDTFKFIPDLPMLEKFSFRSSPCCEEGNVAYFGENIQYKDGDFADFPRLESLKVLALYDNNISLESLKQILANTPNVRHLTISRNKLVKNDDLLCITKLRQLEKCNFQETKVKGSTMKKLASELPNCEFEL